MAVIVRMPTPLRKLTGDRSEIEGTGSNMRELLDNLEDLHPGIRERLVDEGGTVRRFINVYLNEEDIRFLDGLETAVADGDRVTIVPAIAGGLGPGPARR